MCSDRPRFSAVNALLIAIDVDLAGYGKFQRRHAPSTCTMSHFTVHNEMGSSCNVRPKPWTAWGNGIDQFTDHPGLCKFKEYFFSIVDE